jgi:hypothetical protein
VAQWTGANAPITCAFSAESHSMAVTGRPKQPVERSADAVVVIDDANEQQLWSFVRYI